MILAAGLGTRLGELTKATPKCLLEVAGRPMIAYVIGQLRAAGVTEAVINLHHRVEMVRELLEKEKGFGLALEFSIEQKLLGTGGGLLKVKDFFPSFEPFLVVNADIYCELALKDLMTALMARAHTGVLATMQRDDSSHLLFSTQGLLSGWRIKRGREEVLGDRTTVTERAFCGLQALHPRVFAHMTGFPEEFSLIDAYLKAARAGEPVSELPLGNAYWVDMGTKEKLDEPRQRLGRN